MPTRAVHFTLQVMILVSVVKIYFLFIIPICKSYFIEFLKSLLLWLSLEKKVTFDH